MSLSDVIQRVRSGLVQVLLERGGTPVAHGSAFLVEGGLVTNSHVIRVPGIDAVLFRPADTEPADTDSYVRMLPDNCIRAIRAESPESDHDYAFLALDEPEFQGRHRFAFSKDIALQPGQQIVFLGFPFGMAHLTAHVGYVSSTFLRNGRTRVFQVDGSVNGGNSGGPALAADGCVVGLVTRAVTGLIEEQFNTLIAALRDNQRALEGSRGIMRVGAIDPMEALHASQAAMERIALDLHRSANVGIGFVYSAEHVRDHLAGSVPP